MEKIYNLLIVAVAAAAIGLTLQACEAAPQDGTGAK